MAHLKIMFVRYALRIAVKLYQNISSQKQQHTKLGILVTGGRTKNRNPMVRVLQLSYFEQNGVDSSKTTN